MSSNRREFTVLNSFPNNFFKKARRWQVLTWRLWCCSFFGSLPVYGVLWFVSFLRLSVILPLTFIDEPFTYEKLTEIKKTAWKIFGQFQKTFSQKKQGNPQRIHAFANATTIPTHGKVRTTRVPWPVASMCNCLGHTKHPSNRLIP